MTGEIGKQELDVQMAFATVEKHSNPKRSKLLEKKLLKDPEGRKFCYFFFSRLDDDSKEDEGRREESSQQVVASGARRITYQYTTIFNERFPVPR